MALCRGISWSCLHGSTSELSQRHPALINLEEFSRLEKHSQKNQGTQEKQMFIPKFSNGSVKYFLKCRRAQSVNFCIRFLNCSSNFFNISPEPYGAEKLNRKAVAGFPMILCLQRYPTHFHTKGTSRTNIQPPIVSASGKVCPTWRLLNFDVCI